MVKSPSGEQFNKNLFTIINMSKTAEIPIYYAASNAIQILNHAATSFIHCDFSNIRVPDANLSKSFLSAANL